MTNLRQALNPDQEDALNKHFTNVSNSSIVPTRQPEQIGVNSEQILIAIDKFWATHDVKYHDAYQTGKILGKSRKTKDVSMIMLDIENVIEESIKSANAKVDITSENLRDHFQMLSSAIKVIVSDLNALYARKNAKDANAFEDSFNFDHNEMLAMLSGYISAKVYGDQVQ